MSAPKTQVRLIRSGAKRYATSHVIGQGFQTVSVAGEQGRLNKEWSKRDGACKRILSTAAIAQIRAALSKKQYEDRQGGTEPPFMAPSPDPKLYSKVRHACGNEDIVTADKM
jgi:hypothetical protein